MEQMLKQLLQGQDEILKKLSTIDTRITKIEESQQRSEEDILLLKEGQSRTERKISKIDRNIDTHFMKDIGSLDKRIESLEKKVI